MRRRDMNEKVKKVIEKTNKDLYEPINNWIELSIFKSEKLLDKAINPDTSDDDRIELTKIIINLKKKQEQLLIAVKEMNQITLKFFNENEEKLVLDPSKETEEIFWKDYENAIFKKFNLIKNIKKYVNNKANIIQDILEK